MLVLVLAIPPEAVLARAILWMLNATPALLLPILWDRIVLVWWPPNIFFLALKPPRTILRPSPTACGCSSPGSIGVSCSSAGQCACNSGFTGSTCNLCTIGHYGSTCARTFLFFRHFTFFHFILSSFFFSSFIFLLFFPLQACGCGVGDAGNQTCDVQGTCSCNPDFSSPKCASCEGGFYLSSTQCLCEPRPFPQKLKPNSNKPTI